MIRAVVGAIMATFMGVFLLWFLLPLLNTAYESTKTFVDISNPTNATLISIGDGVYMFLPWVTLLVVGYLIFAYATKNVPFDLNV